MIVHRQRILFTITVAISIISAGFFYFHSNLNLSNYDALARLNIARKIIDNLTPGIGQIGGIWLPFPHILFVPFIWSEFLWHSGLAGYIVSGAAFVTGALFLEKTAFLITKNAKASLFVWFMFVTNQNILLFQSMPMSESFFLLGLIFILYFLTKWAKHRSMEYLLAAAICVMIVTLTRYEGYFVFAGTLVTVFVVSAIFHLRKEGIGKVEGTLFLFATIAGYGIVLWCIYSLFFFKDPFYWLHFYSGAGNSAQTATQTSLDEKSLTESFSAYFGASLWMNGLVNSFLGMLGFAAMSIVLVKRFMHKEKIVIYLPIVIITIVFFLLLVFGYQKGLTPDMYSPPLTWPNILNKKLNMYFLWTGPNIRYGLTMAPFIVLFAGYFASRKRFFGILSVILIGYQLLTNFYTPLYLQFSVPKAAKFIYLPAGAWLKSNYDEGLVIISASLHEDMMFQTGLPYNRFIHEGTREYWNRSMNNPAQYARWIIFTEIGSGDRVRELMTAAGWSVLEKQFKVVYEKEGIKIYKHI